MNKAERVQRERKDVWNLLLSGTTSCPYCQRKLKTQNAVKIHIAKQHLGKDWLFHKPA